MRFLERSGGLSRLLGTLQGLGAAVVGWKHYGGGWRLFNKLGGTCRELGGTVGGWSHCWWLGELQPTVEGWEAF